MGLKIPFMLDKGAFAPEKAHRADAGFDFRTPRKFEIKRNSSAIINTGVHMLIPEGYVGLALNKSGLNVGVSILCPDGVIDAEYTGSIVVKLYMLDNVDEDGNHPAENWKFEVGDKIAQIVVIPLADCELYQTDELPKTERGVKGFGSTGR